MMKQTKKNFMAIAFALFSLGIQAQSDRFTCDESCVPDATGAVKYNVVSPVGFSTVEPIKMASRLTTERPSPSSVKILCITSHTQN